MHTVWLSLLARVALPPTSRAEVEDVVAVAEVSDGLAGPRRALHWLPVLPPVTGHRSPRNPLSLWVIYKHYLSTHLAIWCFVLFCFVLITLGLSACVLAGL